MVTIRYKKLKSGKFSAYLDIYTKNGNGKGKRNYEFLSIQVDKDYSEKATRVTEADKDKLKLIQAIRNKREDQLNFSQHGYTAPENINYNLLDYLDECLANKFNYKLECLTIHLHKFLADRKHIVFNDVDEVLLQSFQNFLMKKVSQNTASAYMSIFRQYFNKLKIKGIVQKFPFETFKIIEEEYLERTTLTIEEVRALSKCIPANGNPMVRQAFLFACFTGLRFSDIKKLSYDEISGGEIIFRPAKTPRKIVRIPLVKDALQIIEETEKHEINRKVFWDLPSSQVVNFYLKFWALEVGLKKNLHFHAARHTFATIGLTFGIDIYTMKELLGHSKLEMTQIYAKIVDEKKKNEMLKFPALVLESTETSTETG